MKKAPGEKRCRYEPLYESFWVDERFENLGPLRRLLYQWSRSNRVSNTLTGIYRLPMRSIIAVETGIPVENLGDLWRGLEEAGLIKLHQGYIWVTECGESSVGASPNHNRGILRMLSDAPRELAIQFLTRYPAIVLCPEAKNHQDWIGDLRRLAVQTLGGADKGLAGGLPGAGEGPASPMEALGNGSNRTETPTPTVTETGTCPGAKPPPMAEPEPEPVPEAKTVEPEPKAPETEPEPGKPEHGHADVAMPPGELPAGEREAGIEHATAEASDAVTAGDAGGDTASLRPTGATGVGTPAGAGGEPTGGKQTQAGGSRQEAESRGEPAAGRSLRERLGGLDRADYHWVTATNSELRWGLKIPLEAGEPAEAEQAAADCRYVLELLLEVAGRIGRAMALGRRPPAGARDWYTYERSRLVKLLRATHEAKADNPVAYFRSLAAKEGGYDPS